jgi:RimJ/RimL family protein N-acetyltransferase
MGGQLAGTRDSDHEAQLTSVALRPGTWDDCRFVYETNAHPSVRANAVDTRAIAWSDHQEWYRSKLTDSRSRLWIIEERSRSVGVVRLDIQGDEGDVGLVTVALTPDERGRGVGSRAIQLTGELAGSRMGVTSLVALVRPENGASVRAFERVGYRPAGSLSERGVTLRRYQLDLAADG